MVATEFIEKQFYERFVETLLNLEIDDGTSQQEKIKKMQRSKFKILTELADDLIHNKNSRKHYKLISNLIVLCLSSLNENKSVDICSDTTQDDIEETHSEFNMILQKEFKNAREEFYQSYVENQFIETLNRACSQFAVIDNLIL